jgi:DNA (cytosine-5)-methyltransferase 1
MRCEWQVEIDPYCQRVLAKHWPNVRRWDDVRTFPPEGDWGVDLICGGDPCQGNSNAGSVHKVEHDDTGAEFVRIVDTIRPRIVVRENPSRSRNDALWPWWRMRSELERVGYVVLPFRLRACCVGADHERDRLFLLAELLDANSKRLSRVNRKWITPKHSKRTIINRIRDTWQDSLPSPVICRGDDGIPNRVDRLRGLGNAVVPQVAEWIGRRIMQAVTTNPRS